MAKVNDGIIRMFNEYKANLQLEPTSEEQEARYWRKAKKAADKQNRSPPGIGSQTSSISTPSSDASFLLSPVSQPQLQMILRRSLTQEVRANTMRKVTPTPSLDLMISSSWKKERRRKRKKLTKT